MSSKYKIEAIVFSAAAMYPFVDLDAYLDPGSGSFLLQLIVASLLGALFVLRTSWGRIKAFFQGRSSAEPDSQGDEEE